MLQHPELPPPAPPVWLLSPAERALAVADFDLMTAERGPDGVWVVPAATGSWGAGR